MTRKLYFLLLRAYPPAYRVQFELEMRAVLEEAAGDRSGFSEFAGLAGGAALEWFRYFQRSGKIGTVVNAIGGLAVAGVIQFLIYAVLVPVQHVHAQNRPAAAEPAPLEVVTGLIHHTFAALHDAKTKEDIAKLVDDMEAPDWVSIDPNGYTVLTHDEEVHTLEGFLSVPPEKRPSNNIEILWVHAEPWRITAVELVHSGVQGSAVMPEFRSKETFGAAAESRLVLAGSLVRDTFARTPAGWRRIRHEKLLPDQFSRMAGDSVVSNTPR